MVRSDQPLVERMTLVWHDWFATADVGQVALNLKQNELFRKRGLGSFENLLLAVTKDPAMLVWLSGNENQRGAPNENYARELMELFTLGASNGYSEDDVREQARALTGWTNDWDDDRGMVNFRFEADRHDTGRKRIFGRTGNFDWQDSCRLCVGHPAHAGYFVERLWAYFIPTPPPKRTLRALKQGYRRDRGIRRLVEAILMHPALYEGPRMVKPPIVQIAGMLRARSAGIDTDAWTWIADEAGQRLFQPPNVAGWDEQRWLDTARLSGRWSAAAQNDRAPRRSTPTTTTRRRPRPRRSARHCSFWGNPKLSREDEGGAAALRGPGRERRPRGLAAGQLPGAASERAPDPDRHEPGLPDLMSRIAATSLLRGVHPLRARPALAGRGGAGAARRSSRGMPAPAGTGLYRRSFLLRSGGLALSVYGASLLKPQAFAEGIARGRGHRRARCSSRSSSRAGSTRSRCSRRSPTTLTGGCDRSCGWRPEPGPRGPRTRACSGIPRQRRCISSTARAR